MKNCKDMYFIALISIILPAFFCFSLKAQPANDNICSATSLAVNSSNCSSGTNVSATLAGGDPIGSCWVGGTKSNTVWYLFVAPASGNVTVTTDHTNGGTLTDPQLAVFSSSDGSCTGTLTELGCNDDINSPSNTQSAVQLTGLTPGNTYFIELDGYSTNTGTFCIDIHDGGAILTNDNCANAMNLWVGTTCNYQNECTSTNYPSATNATAEAGETAPACWTQGTALNTVWFTFTAVATSTTLQIEANGGPDPHAAIYSGTCGSLTLVACQEDLAVGGGAGSSNRGVNLSFTTTIGQVYYIQYDSNTPAGCNNICLSSSSGGLTVPANNACAAATTLSLNFPLTGNTWLGTADGGFSCGTTENSVWYKFTPSSSGTFYFTLFGQTGCTSINNSASTHTYFYTSNIQMALYNTGSCTPTSANEINCTSNYNTNDVELSSSLTSGNTYLLLLDGYGNAGCEFQVKVNTTPSVLPVSLLSFSGKGELNENVLEWNTASEINNDYFTLERSEDGTRFTAIGTVKGSGNSNTELKYRFTDRELSGKILYYRLKQTDYDGKENYPGKIIAIPPYSNTKQESTLNVYPNPNNGKSLMIKVNGFKEKEILIVIKDVLGKEFYSKIIPVNNGQTLEVVDPSNALPAGIYFISGAGKNNLYMSKIIVR
jgi:hypothetical protein